jgi:hypothetical protein
MWIPDLARERWQLGIGWRFPAGPQSGCELTQGLRPGLIYFAPPGLDYGEDWSAVLVEDQFSVCGSRFSVGGLGCVGVAGFGRDSSFPPFAQNAKDGAPGVFGYLTVLGSQLVGLGVIEHFTVDYKVGLC